MTTPAYIDGMVCPTTALGTLTIGGVNMHSYAWNLSDLRELWVPNTYRGQNVVLPNASGKRALIYRVDESTYQLPMQLTGVCDPVGNLYPDEYFGLQNNLTYLQDNVIDPPSASATRSASLLMPDGTTRIAEVQVLPLQMGQRLGSVTLCIFTLRCPAGEFVAGTGPTLTPPAFTDTALPDTVVGASYSFTVGATGSPPPTITVES